MAEILDKPIGDVDEAVDLVLLQERDKVGSARGLEVLLPGLGVVHPPLLEKKVESGPGVAQGSGNPDLITRPGA
ncbi:MAG: hypothetical protein BWY86_01315 [Candidatus Aminicenantes bacterium ADurb.Bin508]|nr:MAG: hypothetical protein BWY86_01315 [Candidatus Aminicenantes bacterium ADurb.Bin508]